MKSKLDLIIFWLPRVLSIFFILFLGLFSLDVFGNGYGFWQTAFGLFVHNIPSIILLILLIIAWKHEIVGTLAYGGFALAYLLLVIKTILANGFEWYYLSWVIFISTPALLVAILFLIGQKRKK